MTESVMDRLYLYYTQHTSLINQHASKMPARYGGSEDIWKVRVLSREEFEQNLRNKSRNAEVKVAWICRILSKTTDSERGAILDGIRGSLDTDSAALLEEKSRQAA